MSRQPQSLAQRFRRARESFVLANQLGCSPAEALERMRQQDAARKWQESGDRLRATMAHRSTRQATQSEPPAVVPPDPTTPTTPRMWWND